jgi:putative ABC transport system substrate-binding protein
VKPAQHALQHRIGALAARLLWVLLCAWSAAASAQTLTILLSEESPPYLEAANGIRTALAPEFKDQLVIRTILANALPATDAIRQSALLVTVGSLAAQRAASMDVDVPILATLIPRQAFERIAQGAKSERRRLSAIYLDQPLARQLALIRGVLPEAHTVGVIAGPAMARELLLLKNSVEKDGMRLSQETVTSEAGLFPALQRLLPETDVLLALPDPAVINRGTIQSMLLTTYRYRVPVAGYSASQVDAGVLAAVYSSPAQIAQQATQVIREALKNGDGGLKGPFYPKYFSVKINRNVAHSLGLYAPDEAALKKQLEATTEGEL